MPCVANGKWPFWESRETCFPERDAIRTSIFTRKPHKLLWTSHDSFRLFNHLKLQMPNEFSSCTQPLLVISLFLQVTSQIYPMNMTSSEHWASLETPPDSLATSSIPILDGFPKILRYWWVSPHELQMFPRVMKFVPWFWPNAGVPHPGAAGQCHSAIQGWPAMRDDGFWTRKIWKC